tara:strand:+ start:693 stop:914 length:222 start_codon:yes stop_codon:yes gene_type:complete
MDNITKHLERIDKAIDLLKRNKDKVKKAKENLVAIEKLENDLSISKKTILETDDLLNTAINELDELLSTENKK